MIPPPPRSTLFPYTTLFRSAQRLGIETSTEADRDPPRRGGWQVPGIHVNRRRRADLGQIPDAVGPQRVDERARFELGVSELEQRADRQVSGPREGELQGGRDHVL